MGERKYWKWKKTGSPRGREGHNSFFLPAPRPTTKTPITYDKLFIWAGHSAWNKWYYNRQSKDLSTQQDYRNDMWYYKFPKVQNENINSTACSDCLDSFGDLRECTVGASEADLEGEVEAIGDAEGKEGSGRHVQMAEQILIDPDQRRIDDEYRAYAHF